MKISVFLAERVDLAKKYGVDLLVARSVDVSVQEFVDIVCSGYSSLYSRYRPVAPASLNVPDVGKDSVVGMLVRDLGKLRKSGIIRSASGAPRDVSSIAELRGFLYTVVPWNAGTPNCNGGQGPAILADKEFSRVFEEVENTGMYLPKGDPKENIYLDLINPQSRRRMLLKGTRSNWNVERIVDIDNANRLSIPDTERLDDDTSYTPCQPIEGEGDGCSVSLCDTLPNAKLVGFSSSMTLNAQSAKDICTEFGIDTKGTREELWQRIANTIGPMVRNGTIGKRFRKPMFAVRVTRDGIGPLDEFPEKYRLSLAERVLLEAWTIVQGNKQELPNIRHVCPQTEPVLDRVSPVAELDATVYIEPGEFV